VIAVSTEADIELAEQMVLRIETYLNSGLRQPDRDLQIATEIEAVGNILEGIMTLHTFKIDPLVNYQFAKIADLNRKWTEAKDKLSKRLGR
jgi:hypothetical protein